MNYRNEFLRLLLNENTRVEDLDRFVGIYNNKMLFTVEILNPMFIVFALNRVISTNHLGKIKWFSNQFPIENLSFHPIHFTILEACKHSTQSVMSEDICDFLLRAYSKVLENIHIPNLLFKNVLSNNWTTVAKKLIKNEYGFKNISDMKSKFIDIALEYASSDILDFLYENGHFENINHSGEKYGLFQCAFYSWNREKTNEQCLQLVQQIKEYLDMSNEETAKYLVQMHGFYIHNIPELVDLVFKQDKSKIHKVMNREDLIWAHMMAIFYGQSNLEEKIEPFIDWSATIEKFPFERLSINKLTIRSVEYFLNKYEKHMTSYDYFNLFTWLKYSDWGVILEDLLIHRPEFVAHHFTMENIMRRFVRYDIGVQRYWDILDWVLSKNPLLDIHGDNYRFFKESRRSDTPTPLGYTDGYLFGFVERYPEHYREMKKGLLYGVDLQVIYLAVDEEWIDFQHRIEAFLDKYTYSLFGAAERECLICHEKLISENAIRTCVSPSYEIGHIYCKPCILEWLREDRTNCPYCRECII